MNMPEDKDPAEGCFSPKRASFRFIGLALISIMGFGSYFCYDNPGALQDNFESELNMTTKKFLLLYSVCFWPNVIMGFIGGFLLDRVFGIRRGTIIYMILTLVGQLTFATGVYFNAYWMMIVGRLGFGIGTESLTISQSIYAVLWFKGKELNMVFGLQLCVARVGATVNFLVMEPIYTYITNTLGYKGPQGIGITLFVAILFFLTSVISTLFLAIMDKKAETVLREKEDQIVEKVKLQDVKDFKYNFWLSAIICCTFYVTIFPFLSIAKVYFITKYGFEPGAANTITSLVFIISAVACPVIGILVDKTGKNILWVIASVIGTLLAHSLLAFTSLNPYVSMVLLGLSFSIFTSSYWTLLTAYIPTHQLGTAYGTVLAFQSLGLALIPIICGIIVDNYGYFTVQIFFLFLLLISLGTAVTVWISDKNTTAIYSIDGIKTASQ